MHQSIGTKINEGLEIFRKHLQFFAKPQLIFYGNPLGNTISSGFSEKAYCSVEQYHFYNNVSGFWGNSHRPPMPMGNKSPSKSIDFGLVSVLPIALHTVLVKIS